jgi:hypothetical protein
MKLPRQALALLGCALFLSCSPAQVKPPPGSVGLGGTGGGYAGSGGAVAVAGSGGAGGYAGVPGGRDAGRPDAAAGAGGGPVATPPPPPRPPDARPADRPLRPDTPPPVLLLYVTGSGANAMLASDDDLIDHLRDRGFDLNIEEDGTVNQADVDEAAAILLSASTDSATVLMSLPDAATLDKPILAMDENLEPLLNMVGGAAGDRGTVNQTEVAMLAGADAALSAGLSGTVTVFSITAGICFGVPGPGALKVASVVGNADQVALYAYPKGAMMANNATAPAKRVFFFMRENAAENLLTADGLKLFDAALDFALAP